MSVHGLSESNSLIPEPLVCTICQELMLNPYSLGCGHTFCGLCLQHWFKNRQYNNGDKTCPTCRTKVTVKPVHVHALRELADNVLAAVEKADPAHAAEIREHSQPHSGPLFDEFHFAAPMRDREDDVYRCPECNWEIEDGTCVNCGYSGGRVGFHSESDAFSLSQDDDEVDDLGGFVDDDIVYDDEESDDDAISNIQRRPIRRLHAIISSSESDSEHSRHDEDHTGSDHGRTFRMISSEESESPLSSSDHSVIMLSDED